MRRPRHTMFGAARPLSFGAKVRRGVCHVRLGTLVPCPVGSQSAWRGCTPLAVALQTPLPVELQVPEVPLPPAPAAAPAPRLQRRAHRAGRAPAPSTVHRTHKTREEKRPNQSYKNVLLLRPTISSNSIRYARAPPFVSARTRIRASLPPRASSGRRARRSITPNRYQQP